VNNHARPITRCRKQNAISPVGEVLSNISIVESWPDIEVLDIFNNVVRMFRIRKCHYTTVDTGGNGSKSDDWIGERCTAAVVHRRSNSYRNIRNRMCRAPQNGTLNVGVVRDELN